ncbi:MAG: endolytic transglycosylase MltG [Gammaproteobacteria bacterium]
MTAKRRLAAAAVLLAAGAAGFGFWRYYEETVFAGMLARPLTAAAAMEVPPGASLRDIAEIGAESGAPVSIAEFILAARRLNIASKLQAGYYEFKAGESVRDILTSLASGKVAPPPRFTIAEGLTYGDLRALLRADRRLAQKLPQMDEEEIRREMGAEEGLEGMFLPETYFFNRGDSDLDLLRRARREMQKTLEELWERRRDGGLFNNSYEALALASIVEKETGVAEERPLIASAFVNRLRRGMRLQADPTVIYGLGAAFDGNLTRAHLRDKTNPYNTYAHRGLTPTPIALPGKAAISAALNPPETKYYYFVASGDGRHVFSETLRAHNNAVNTYQRRRRRK